MAAAKSLVALTLLVSDASAFLISSSRSDLARVRQSSARTAQIVSIAQSDADKAVLAASKNVMLKAKRFGPEQGKAAAAWVEASLEAGDSRKESLMEMQLALFEECKLDDGAKCQQLNAAIEALTTAVCTRKEEKAAGKKAGFVLNFGATPIQAAATKVRAAASKFGPEQKKAADAWIAKVAAGDIDDGSGLLEQQVMLFGECLLSEDGTPSNCEQLNDALDQLQAAIEGKTGSTEATSVAAPPTLVGKVTPTKQAKPAPKPGEPGYMKAVKAKMEAEVASLKALEAEKGDLASKQQRQAAEAKLAYFMSNYEKDVKASKSGDGIELPNPFNVPGGATVRAPK